MPAMKRNEALGHADRGIACVLSDPAVSDWLKAALRAQLRRDPVDAVADAAMLQQLLAVRCDAILAADQRLAEEPQLPFDLLL